MMDYKALKTNLKVSEPMLPLLVVVVVVIVVVVEVVTLNSQ